METQNQKNNKNILYGVVVALIIANIAFKLLNHIEIEQTSLLFVGIPAIITILLIKYGGKPANIYGVVFKTVTLFLLLSSVLLGEGLVCIIIMAPIFYLVAGIIAFIIEYFNKKNKSKLNSFILIPVLLILAQVHEINKKPDVLNIETKSEISQNIDFNAFNTTPNFLENLPNFFKIGFPKPIAIEGKGVNVGDYRKIQFESNTKGIGILHLKIKEKTKNTILFDVIEDNTHIAHWLTWKQMRVSIENKNNSTIITWNTYFTCDLGPSWYFKPIESYGVKTMNTFLIDSFFIK